MWFTKKWYNTGKIGKRTTLKANGFSYVEYYEQRAHIEKEGIYRWRFLESCTLAPHTLRRPYPDAIEIEEGL